MPRAWRETPRPGAGRARGLGLALGLAAGLAAFSWPAHARAHRPQTRGSVWEGLDRATTTAPADGLRVLRAAPGGRIRIPGGTFLMGSTPAAMTHAIDLCEREVRAPLCHEVNLLALVRAEGVAHAVTLSTFEMDRTEVTVADYDRCVSAGSCAPTDFAPNDPFFAGPNLPVTHVRWEDATAFCRWRGGRLPTEAEWEYAARGQGEREFPWGAVYNPHLANHGAWADDFTDGTDGFLGLAPVGSFPDGATPLGLLDMAGNAAEWVADVFEFDGAGLPVPYPGEAEVDPKPRSSGGVFHVVRGGSFADGAMWLRGAARDTTSSPRPPWVGFRCAADVR